MRDFEHECCDCTAGAYPCLGSSCPNGITHFYCDECGAEAKLYIFEGLELCMDCILANLEEVS